MEMASECFPMFSLSSTMGFYRRIVILDIWSPLWLRMEVENGAQKSTGGWRVSQPKQQVDAGKIRSQAQTFSNAQERSRQWTIY